MTVKAGCAGYRYYRAPNGWKDKYEQKIQAYADKFPLLELNSTFYKLPRVSTAEKWKKLVEEVNDQFTFTVKANQRITHSPSSPTYDKANFDIPDEQEDKFGYFRPTQEVFDAWTETKEICEALNVDICLFQTPASFRPTEGHLENLKHFFSQISGDFAFAFEPRGNEWESLKLNETRQNLIRVVDPFMEKPSVTTGLAYFRLHGLGKRRYRYKFTNEDLLKLSETCKEHKGKVYVVFNNFEMFNDCQRFLHYEETGEFTDVSWGAKAVVDTIAVDFPTTRENILSKCGRWWVWVNPDKSIRVKEALMSVEKEKFANEGELLQAIKVSTDLH